MEPLTEEIEEERIDTMKEWNKFCSSRFRREIQQIDNVICLQKAALENLRQLDVDLYKQIELIKTRLVGKLYTGRLYQQNKRSCQKSWNINTVHLKSNILVLCKFQTFVLP